MIKHSCCLLFLTTAVSVGVGWVLHIFLLVAFVCSHPTFECYIIGASLSEPLLDELAGAFLWYIYIIYI